MYDGAIWKEFEQSMILILMQYLLHIGLMLNVDWFNPFKKGLYSAGAIYLSILNLPRLVRFKKENSIPNGLIPGPKEPSLTINSFIAPLVNELEALCDGVLMECLGLIVIE